MKDHSWQFKYMIFHPFHSLHKCFSNCLQVICMKSRNFNAYNLNSNFSNWLKISNRFLYNTKDTLLFTYNLLTMNPPPGGGGFTQKSFIQGGSTPRSNPLPFYIPFFSEKASLSYTFYWKKAPLSYTFVRRLMNKSLKQEVFLSFLTHSLRCRMSCCGQWENGVSRNLRRRKWPR